MRSILDSLFGPGLRELEGLLMDERRRNSRASLLLEIRWEDLSGKYNARITDISLDGCYIESIGQVTVGAANSF